MKKSKLTGAQIVHAMKVAGAGVVSKTDIARLADQITEPVVVEMPTDFALSHPDFCNGISLVTNPISATSP